MEDNKEYKNNKCLKFFLFFFNLLLFLNGLVLLILSIIVLNKIKFQKLIIIYISLSAFLLINACIGLCLNSRYKINLIFTIISFILTIILSILLFIDHDLDFIDDNYDDKENYKEKKLYYKIVILSSCVESILMIVFYYFNNKQYNTRNGPSLLKNISGLKGEDLLKGVNFNPDNDMLI